MVKLLLTGDKTDGRYAVVETVERRGGEPPLHCHRREDELVYVLMGQVRFHLEGQDLERNAGECVLLPNGLEHTYSIVSEEARLLTLLAPAGLEQYYRELGESSETRGAYQDAEFLVVLSAKYGVNITGPPGYYL